MIITGKYPNLRLRRNRNSDWSRRLVRENTLSVNDLILPIFLVDGNNKKQSIKTMPEIYRYSINRLSEVVDKAVYNKIPMVALFPHTENKKKTTPSKKELLREIEALDKAKKRNQLIIGFAAETKNLVENASKKLESKNLDFIVANDVSAPGVGFRHDTNSVSVIDRNGASTEIPLCDKREIARNVIDIVSESWSMQGTDPKIQ